MTYVTETRAAPAVTTRLAVRCWRSLANRWGLLM
jgi:hypothetical protein